MLLRARTLPLTSIEVIEVKDTLFLGSLELLGGGFIKHEKIAPVHAILAQRDGEMAHEASVMTNAEAGCSRPELPLTETIATRFGSMSSGENSKHATASYRGCGGYYITALEPLVSVNGIGLAAGEARLLEEGDVITLVPEEVEFIVNLPSETVSIEILSTPTASRSSLEQRHSFGLNDAADAGETMHLLRPSHTGYEGVAEAFHPNIDSQKMSDLIMASFKRDMKLVTENGDSPLFFYSSHGRDDIVKLLITNGELPNTPSVSGYPLHMACQNGHLSTVDLLLSKGADINAVDPINGKTALFFAAGSGNLKIVRVLLKREADVYHRRPCGESILLCAVGSGKEDVVQFLLKFTEAKEFLEAENSRGEFPLLRACDRGYTQIIVHLLSAGADPNHHSSQTLATPLICSAYRGYTNIVRYLVERGANLAARDSLGRSAVDAATHPECIEVLLAFIAHRNKIDNLVPSYDRKL